MRTITGYRDGHPVWSENVPSSGAEFGFHLGGTAIDTSSKPRPPHIKDVEAQRRYRAKRAGEAQKDPQP